MALAIALVAVGLVTIAFPLTKDALQQRPSATPVQAVSEGFSATLNSQASGVAAALTQSEAPSLALAIDPSSALHGLPGASLVPEPILATATHVLVQGALAGADGKPPLAMDLQPAVSFTLHDDGFLSPVLSTRPTVGGALEALGAKYSGYDIVYPAADTPLTAGLHVYLKRATSLWLSVGGKHSIEVHTHEGTVAGLLAERGVELQEGDTVDPPLATPLARDMGVTVTVVRQKTVTEDTAISFLTIYRDDSGLTQGETAVARAGIDGLVRREYLLTFRNGEPVGRELVSEYTIAPTSRVIAQGTAAPVAVAVAVAAAVTSGPGDCANPLGVWATWYTAASAGGSGRTATGTGVYKGIVAVDPHVIPLGTNMYIPGYGYGVAADTGGGIRGNMIDLGYGPNDAKNWRSGNVTICILY